MDKILKRSAQLTKSANKRTAKRWKHVKDSQERSIRLEHERMRKATTGLIIAERKRRQEQWHLGALAPRHDVGDNALRYGTMPSVASQIPKEYDKRRPDWFHIKAIDRVMIMMGRARGKIAEVQSVDEERCCVTVKGVKVDYCLPEHLRSMSQGKQVLSISMQIPLRDVRLVYALKDSQTDTVKDVIVDRMVPVGREWDRHKRELTKGQRLIYGTDTIIPWPEETVEDFKAYPEDTTVDLVDEETFQPSLMVTPMPLGLIDELRSKYSRTRTRFDWETRHRIALRENKEEQRKELTKTMRTPLQELADLRAEQKVARERDLTTEQLARIGEIMAEAQSRASSSVSASVSASASA